MKTETQDSLPINTSSHPTNAEIAAYIAKAHRLRGECFAKMISSVFRGITGLFLHLGERSTPRPINTPS
jgi:hypothetical protein